MPTAAEAEALQQRIDEVSAEKLEAQASLQQATGEQVACTIRTCRCVFGRHGSTLQVSLPVELPPFCGCLPAERVSALEKETEERAAQIATLEGGSLACFGWMPCCINN